jgi:hypothetical protein
MAGVTHVVLIDESGNGRLLPGGPDPGVRSLWVTAGVAVEWDMRRTLDEAIKSILKRLFLGRCDELRAANIRRYLPEKYSVADVAREVADAVQKTASMVWISGTRAGARMFSHPLGERAEAKDIARQLLLETISGYAVPRYYAPESWLIVWDVADAGELADFSRTVATFRNRISGYPAPPALMPAMLGGLSHDWGGIQVADLYANFALHRFGRVKKLVGAKPERADAFDTVLAPTLKRDNAGKLVGLKFWEER